MPRYFYVSDSFTINPYTNAAWHYPGAANSDKAWGFNEVVTVEWLNGEMGFIVYSTVFSGANGDVFLGLYDIGNVSSGIAQPVLTSSGGPTLLKFMTSSGAPMGDSILVNGVHLFGSYSRAQRDLAQPITLGGVMTPTSSSTQVGPFQVGAVMRFFGGADGIPLAYQYFLHGNIPDVVATSSGSNGGSTGAFMILTLPDSSQWQIPASAV